jgi:ketose-bisphosphate aldolase
MFYRPRNLYTLNHLLEKGEKGGFAVGAFSARSSEFFKPIFRAGQRTQSPIIVQITSTELKWYQITFAQFANDFWTTFETEKPTVPVVLHLDHTQDIEIIKEAISLGFTSVMIDASARPLEDNIKITQEVVAYAHARGVSVEGELGKIGTTDMMETETDEELFTDPAEAEYFVKMTGVDALAVSVGTAHGVYTIHQPKVDVERIKAIRARTPVHLVLHGGSGTPKELIYPAIHLEKGGISKINVATDLELALLGSLGLEDRINNYELKSLPAKKLEKALAAVESMVEDKIINFLGSDGHAKDF